MDSAMNISDIARPFLDFMAQNQALTIFLSAMVVVGFALYVVLQAVTHSNSKSAD